MDEAEDLEMMLDPDTDYTPTTLLGLTGYCFEPEYTDEELEMMERCRLEQAELREENVVDTAQCTCGNCCRMDSVKEQVCCHEVPNTSALMDFDDEVDEQCQCICEHEDFEAVCLRRATLQTAYVHMMMYRKGGTGDRSLKSNRQFRLCAYRQFVCFLQQGQKLGRHNRIVIPACVVARIRLEFPAEEGETYTGFKDAADLF